MTGHKSKGLEFNRVWFLDPGLCRIDRDQDANIKYVIETRAKDFLAYVSTETFVAAAD
jgi:ATP-dependent exoDNAse (exonuclease V) beta subunit